MEDNINKKNEKIERLDNNQDNNEIKNNGIDHNNPYYIGIIPYRAEDITFSMLNNPDDPKYIGHLFKSEKKGAEYNL